MGNLGIIFICLALITCSSFAFQKIPVPKGSKWQKRIGPVTEVSGGKSTALNSVQPLLEGVYDPLYNYANFWVKTGMFNIVPSSIV